jgi:hypothetical protein
MLNYAFDCSHHVRSLSSKLEGRRKKPYAPLEQVISRSIVLFKMQLYLRMKSRMSLGDGFEFWPSYSYRHKDDFVTGVLTDAAEQATETSI